MGQAHPSKRSPRDQAAFVMRERWRMLMGASAAPPDAAGTALAELLAAYSAPDRHYHSLQHIAELLGHVERQAGAFADRASVELAIFYHDAVYEIARKDNEAASARLVETRLPGLGIAPARVARVAALVEATAHGTADPDPGDADMLRFLDLDLSILAAPRADYADYAAAIRAEYACVPEPLYRAGRRKVLQSFLGQPRIFRSPDLHMLWDARARENLRWEIGLLDAGAIPGGPAAP